jgi:hypothetical protein
MNPDTNVQHTIFELPLTDEPDDDDPPSERPGHGNTPPTADGSKTTPHTAFINENILFNGSKSYDYDGWIVEWIWSFGDGTTGSGEIVSHAYDKAGTYRFYLNVTDNEGSKGSYTSTAQVIQANNPPSTPTITGETDCNSSISYTYTFVSTDLDNDTIRYIISFGDGTDNQTTEYLANNTNSTLSHIWGGAGVYLISAYAEDALGALSDTAQTSITVDGNQQPDKKSGDNIPGFELFTLIAALGLAFIIFKRRKQ